MLFSRPRDEETENSSHYSTWNDNIINDTAKVTCEMNVLKSHESWEIQPVLKFLNPNFQSLWDLEWIKILMIMTSIFVVLGAIREIYQLIRYEFIA